MRSDVALCLLVVLFMTVRKGGVKHGCDLARSAKFKGGNMFELVRTNDPVLISWLQAQFQGLDIDILVLDEHMSIMDGSISAIPRRIMVPEAYRAQAEDILAEADRLAAGEGA